MRRTVMDAKLSDFRAREIEDRADYRIIGWFEKWLPANLEPAAHLMHTPADLEVYAHSPCTAEARCRRARSNCSWVAFPLRWDLTEAIAAIKAGTIDAQENPFANTVTYGVHKFHRCFHTVNNQFYVARPIFMHSPTF